jgi:hypothetical protein
LEEGPYYLDVRDGRGTPVRGPVSYGPPPRCGEDAITTTIQVSPGRGTAFDVSQYFNGTTTYRTSTGDVSCRDGFTSGAYSVRPKIDPTQTPTVLVYPTSESASESTRLPVDRLNAIRFRVTRSSFDDLPPCNDVNGQTGAIEPQTAPSTSNYVGVGYTIQFQVLDPTVPSDGLLRARLTFTNTTDATITLVKPSCTSFGVPFGFDVQTAAGGNAGLPMPAGPGPCLIAPTAVAVRPQQSVHFDASAILSAGVSTVPNGSYCSVDIVPGSYTVAPTASDISVLGTGTAGDSIAVLTNLNVNQLRAVAFTVVRPGIDNGGRCK